MIRVAAEFATEEACLAYLEQKRWPEGVRCPQCGHNRISRFTVEEGVRSSRRYSKRLGAVVKRRIPARRLYQCLKPGCQYQFTAKTGTRFDNSHLPLTKWFLAVALMANAKQRLSAKQMQRDLKIGYQTAWHLCHRIRDSMLGGSSEPATQQYSA
jgi:transposase-like protein